MFACVWCGCVAVNIGNDGVAGLWCRDILAAVMQATPHVWPRHTLERFPAPVRELFAQYGAQRDDKQQLKVSNIPPPLSCP